METYVYSVLLVFQFALMTCILSSNVDEKERLISEKLPINPLKKDYGVVPQTKNWRVEPAEESCESSSFQNDFDNLTQRVNCEPRDTVVTLVPSFGYTFIPDILIVKRCDGACSGVQRCLPTVRHKAKFHIKSVSKVNNHTECKLISVNEDARCRCNCKQKPKNCNDLQVFNTYTCSYICKNQAEYQNCLENPNDHMVWDDSTCSCKCQRKKHCPTGTYWRKRTCRCEEFFNPSWDFVSNEEYEYIE